ncbi:hypothetical protein [Actinosynnema sp. NPDC020468]|uniref:hypothetical protein n=1 Tax=Actinosynnema sp. NPDC020468 TaxID=3154488 RepID=UPI0033FA47DF
MRKKNVREDESTLISAGAILPGTAAAGQDRDTITARHYTHPGLGDRVVVRLVPAVLGKAEDLTCEYLGFAAPARTAEVGTGRRSALGFPAWALVNDPANGHHALNLVKDVERLARTARSRAGAAKDGFTALGEMLGRSAPHFLPTFYEQAGRIFLEHGNTTFAATMFGKAREAEEVHDLKVDPERIREVFLEFAFAGALTAKALSAHAKGLARKHDVDAAYELFLTLCVERTRGGLPPYTGMPEDLRRLAKAAKRDLRTEDERLLAAVLDSSSINRATASFWKFYRDSLVALAKKSEEVRVRLLSFVPSSVNALDTWVEILRDCGAFEYLTGTAPEGTTPPAAWLSSLLAVRSSGWRSVDRSAVVLDLVAEMADRLVADGIAVVVLRGWRQGELDLLDLLVARGVPVNDQERGELRLELSHWLADEQPGARDLAALAADERFVGPLGNAFVECVRTAVNAGIAATEVLLPGMAVPGLRSALRRWLTDRVGEVAVTGMPDLGLLLDRLAAVRVPEAFADVPEAAETLAETDVAAALHATLRAGLVDEVEWPALEEAVALLGEPQHDKDDSTVVCGEGWPALVLRRGEKFVVVGPDGVLLEHLARVPPEARNRWSFEPTAAWFDGVLLVRWQGPDGPLAYWSDAPDRVFEPEGASRSYYYSRDEHEPSVALPGGGRFAGHRAVHPGDTSLPVSDVAFGDGTTLWSGHHHDRAWRWVEVDPATGERGRNSLPAFIEDFAADGATLRLSDCDLRPATEATAASPLGAASGLHGWRVRKEADGSWLGESVAGDRVRLPRGAKPPVGVLNLPAGSRLVLAQNGNEIHLLEEEGTLLGTVLVGGRRSFGAPGTPLVPPLDWWHLLRPRDEAGSAALRGVDRKTVDGLIAVAAAERKTEKSLRGKLTALVRGDREDLERAVLKALPGLEHPGLLAGVVAVVRRAGELLKSYRGYAKIASAARTVDPTAFTPAGPDVAESVVNEALSWFSGGNSGRSGGTPTKLPALIGELGAVAAEAKPEGRALGATTSTEWYDALPHLGSLVYRAASPLTPQDQREALVLVLRTLTEHGLADGAGQWRVVEVVVPEKTADPRHRITPVADGFLALFAEHWNRGEGDKYEGVQFTRTPGSYSLPKGWVVSSETRVTSPFGGDRVRRFLAALAENGPLSWRPEAVPALVERTGLGTAEATVLLAGMPGVDRWDASYLSTADRHLLDVSAAAAKTAKERLKPLSDTYRHRLLAAAVPADPADLWTSGPDVAAVAEVWTAEHGVRRPVPDDVLVDATKRLPTRGAGEYVTAVLNPESTVWLTTDKGLRLEGTDLNPRHPEGFSQENLMTAPQVLRWLAHRLPAGSPLRAKLPVALDLIRRRVADPGFAVDFGGWHDAESVTALAGEVPAVGSSTTVRGWLEVIRVNEHYCRLIIRPALVGAGDRDLLVAAAETTNSREAVAALDLVADADFEAACAAVAPEGADPEAYFQDPAFSVPHLVAEVAATLGLPEDAAVLYLQLLALPDPTDANVARWTAWKPARLRKARAALAETTLVLTAKRARAGRTLFLPGGWLPLGTPHLPLESWKATMFGFTLAPPHGTVVAPRQPIPTLFEQAWSRVRSGDAPAYEELKTGTRR